MQPTHFVLLNYYITPGTACQDKIPFFSFWAEKEVYFQGRRGKLVSVLKIAEGGGTMAQNNNRDNKQQNNQNQREQQNQRDQQNNQQNQQNQQNNQNQRENRKQNENQR